MSIWLPIYSCEGYSALCDGSLRDVVPVPKYQNWYPYPSTHCGTCTRTSVSTWLGTRTRTYTHFIVPIPVPRYQYPYPYFSPAWYPYPYLRVGTRTRTYGLVPVPLLIPILGTHTHEICEPKLLCFNYSGTPASALSYTLYSCLWVCKPISTMLRQYRHSCKVCWLLSLSEEKMFHRKSIDDVPVSLTKIKSYQIPNYRFDFLQIAKPS